MPKGITFYVHPSRKSTSTGITEELPRFRLIDRCGVVDSIIASRRRMSVSPQKLYSVEYILFDSPMIDMEIYERLVEIYRYRKTDDLLLIEGDRLLCISGCPENNLDFRLAWFMGFLED